MSVACAGPGTTLRCWTELQVVGAAGVGGGVVEVSRQIAAVMGSRRVPPSVVSAETVQVSRTRSPTRWAVRALAGFGRWSEGGLGGPGLAQPVRVRRTADAGTSVPVSHRPVAGWRLWRLERRESGLLGAPRIQIRLAFVLQKSAA
jgi:hypothetical protein